MGFEEQKERVEKLAEKWIGPLGLKWWRVEICYLYEREKGQNDGAEVAFRTYSMPEYHSATMNAYLPTIESADDDQLEKLFVHELMHTFTAELIHEQDDMEYHIEHVCTRLAKAFVWVRQFAEEEAENAD